MTYIRRALLALVLSFSLAPAFAQVPAAVPALPDTERRTSYSITATTCACNVNFALYGDSTDYQNWVEVFINGVRYDFNDATHGWTITSPSGSLSTLARPITNAVLTFNAVQTGTVQIVGARRPRRASQFNENAGVSARNLNQVFTDIISQNREIWDKNNDMTGRAILGLPGETISPLQAAASRAGKFFIWDGSGNPSTTSPSLGTGNVLGPGSSVVNGFARWNNTAGTLLKDSGTQIVTADIANNAVTPAQMSQGIANSIFINPTNSTANVQNLAVPACANDGAHGLVYINGTGLQCATMTPPGTGTVTSVTCGTGLSGGTITGTGTCALALTNASLQASPANPTGTASTAAQVMMGLGSTCKITPVYSGRVLVKFGGYLGITTAVNGLYRVTFGTGSAPANAAALTGTLVGNDVNQTSTAGGVSVMDAGGIITGLSVGTQIWLDFALKTGGGTATISNPTCYAMEF